MVFDDEEAGIEGEARGLAIISGGEIGVVPTRVIADGIKGLDGRRHFSGH